MHIESIQFKHYKLLRDATLPLESLTVIVGPNGSGKSTAMDVLGDVADITRDETPLWAYRAARVGKLRGSGGAASVAYKQMLKKHASGSSAPRGVTAKVAERLIRRALAESGLLATAFPGGYGTLEAAIRAW